jgi:hypothetical protein
MSEHVMKRHDLLPILELILEDDEGPRDLTNATTLTLLMTDSSGALVLSEEMGKDPDQVNNIGRCSYEWVDGDTDVAGKYKAEVEVIWSNNKPETFPSSGTFTIKINADLNDLP